MWRLGLIYTRVRRKHTTESQSRGRKRKRLRWHYLSEGVSILIGSLPLFQPGVPVLEFVSSAEDYGQSETGIISRNKAQKSISHVQDSYKQFDFEENGNKMIGLREQE
ncbi:hypothetical protein DBV15_06008 [Temnothorax longispinosus]|uniref:Uncharacterized protein n=1 Tax=Temnothorax longispinosus TaxID=300112 RepID=A0A4S2KMQ0_9HYME|nr:hypothetical protein DBV15_06008 [Temnothorax longispinosus]